MIVCANAPLRCILFECMKESDASVCRCNDQIHFIACPTGPLHGKRCQVWSVGITLEAWGKELEAAGVQVIGTAAFLLL